MCLLFRKKKNEYDFSFLCITEIVCLFFEIGLLYIPFGCPGIHYIYQAGLKKILFQTIYVYIF